MIDNHSILIADRDYHPFLYAFRQSHPELDVQFLDKNAVVDLAGKSIKKDPIPFLIASGIDYARAKKWASLFRVADESKFSLLPKVESLYSQVKDCFEEDPLGLYQLKQSSLYLFEADEDQELQALLKRKGLSFSLVHFEDLGIAKVNDLSSILDCDLSIYRFKSKYQQFNHIYSSIRSLLLAKEEVGDDPFLTSLKSDPHKERRIKVLLGDEYDYFYAENAASLFSLPSCGLIASSFLSKPEIMAKVKAIFSSKSFAFSEEELQKPLLAYLKKNIVDYYGLDAVPFEQGYASLIEICQAKLDKTPLSEEGISLVADFTFDPEALIFITNFQYGSFYRVYDDKNVLSDEELLLLEANPSYQLTFLDRRKKLNYLQYQHLALLSRVNEHLTDSIYDSSFLEEWNDQVKTIVSSIKDSSLPEEEKQKQIEQAKKKYASFFKTAHIVNPKGSFTKEMEPLLLADQYDKLFYYGKEGAIRSCDHSFKPFYEEFAKEWGEYLNKIHTKERNGKVTTSWAITNLEAYPSCPFKYFLSTLIKEERDTFTYTNLGVLCHAILENAFSQEKPFSDPSTFEALFQEGVIAFKEQLVKNGESFDEEKQLYLDLYHYFLSRFYRVYGKWQEKMTLVKELPEQFISFSLSDEQGSYDFTGFIDKILLTKNKAGDIFYTVLDYKTGAEEFDAKAIFLGKSTQLPIYLSALQNPSFGNPRLAQELNGATFGGFGIQHIYFSSLKNAMANSSDFLSEATLGDRFAFKGAFLCQAPYLYSIHDDAIEVTKKRDGTVKEEIKPGRLVFINSKSQMETMDTDTLLEESKDVVYTIPEAIEDAKKATLSVIHKIEAADFPIAPTPKDITAKVGQAQSLNCSNCPYKDICYRDPHKDAVSHAREVKAKFALKQPKKEEPNGI